MKSRKKKYTGQLIRQLCRTDDVWNVPEDGHVFINKLLNISRVAREPAAVAEFGDFVKV